MSSLSILSKERVGCRLQSYLVRPFCQLFRGLFVLKQVVDRDNGNRTTVCTEKSLRDVQTTYENLFGVHEDFDQCGMLSDFTGC